MILEKESVQVETSKQFESKEMSISPEFFNKMIWHTIKQYKYKIRTSVQELISNAIDAQVDAGNKDRPLKIQLPSKIEPVFKLRDYGTGITPEVMDKIYRNMGASGSSHTNGKKGGFGIGGKSPLGFTDQYNIKTYVDGTFWFYVVYKNKNNGINVDLLQSGNTTEENGTEIQIPSRHDQVNDFKKAACRATMFWDVQPIFNTDNLYRAVNGLKLSDNLTVYNKNDLDNMFDNGAFRADVVICVDGIPYELDRDIIEENLYELSRLHQNDSVVVFKVNVGDVKPLQTRESLESCELTNSKLKSLNKEGTVYVESYIDKIGKCNTLSEVIDKYNSVSKLFSGIPAVEYKGVTVWRDLVGVVDQKNNSSKLELIEYHFRKKNRWSKDKTVNSKKDTKQVSSIDIKDINKIYLDDTDESMVMKSRRLKHKIEDSKDNIFLINEMSDDVKKLLDTHFSLKKLSSLPLPPKKERSAVVKKKLGQGKVDIHVLMSRFSNRTKKTVDLSCNTIKYVYDNYLDSTLVEDTRYKRLIENRGYKVCLVAQKYIKELVGNDNFISLDQFNDSLNLKVSEINHTIVKESRLNESDIRLAKLMQKSGDKLLTQYAKYVNIGYDDTLDLPRSIVIKIIEQHSEAIKNAKKYSRFIGKMAKNKYPHLGRLSTNADKLSYIHMVNRQERLCQK